MATPLVGGAAACDVPTPPRPARCCLQVNQATSAARAVITAPVTIVSAVGQGTLYTVNSCASSLRFKFALPTIADLRHCLCVPAHLH